MSNKQNNIMENNVNNIKIANSVTTKFEIEGLVTDINGDTIGTRTFKEEDGTERVVEWMILTVKPVGDINALAAGKQVKVINSQSLPAVYEYLKGLYDNGGEVALHGQQFDLTVTTVSVPNYYYMRSTVKDGKKLKTRVTRTSSDGTTIPVELDSIRLVRFPAEKGSVDSEITKQVARIMADTKLGGGFVVRSTSDDASEDAVDPSELFK